MLNLSKKMKSSEQTGSPDIRIVVRLPIVSENEPKEGSARRSWAGPPGGWALGQALGVIHQGVGVGKNSFPTYLHDEEELGDEPGIGV